MCSLLPLVPPALQRTWQKSSGALWWAPDVLEKRDRHCRYHVTFLPPCIKSGLDAWSWGSRLVTIQIRELQRYQPEHNQAADARLSGLQSTYERKINSSVFKALEVRSSVPWSWKNSQVTHHLFIFFVFLVYFMLVLTELGNLIILCSGFFICH